MRLRFDVIAWGLLSVARKRPEELPLRELGMVSPERESSAGTIDADRNGTVRVVLSRPAWRSFHAKVAGKVAWGVIDGYSDRLDPVEGKASVLK